MHPGISPNPGGIQGIYASHVLRCTTPVSCKRLLLPSSSMSISGMRFGRSCASRHFVLLNNLSKKKKRFCERHYKNVFIVNYTFPEIEERTMLILSYHIIILSYHFILSLNGSYVSLREVLPIQNAFCWIKIEGGEKPGDGSKKSLL